ncbi:hypothetical protein HAX54_025347 [Datura stramonium]|uniref:Uncharacterized protein n=1 Tax=Datura stramonium TaxID=4076 RepID=A0ABS8S7I1_DATST|nr:hypothetical protein [Datura stramonium]
MGREEIGKSVGLGGWYLVVFRLFMKRNEREERKGWRRKETVAGMCMVSGSGDFLPAGTGTTDREGCLRAEGVWLALVVHKLAPVVRRLTPVVRKWAPTVQRLAPVVHILAPAVHSSKGK